MLESQQSLQPMVFVFSFSDSFEHQCIFNFFFFLEMAFPYNLPLVLVIVCAGKYKFRGNEHQWLLWSSTERSRIGMLIIILLNLAKQFDIYTKPLLTVDIVKFNGATSRRLLCKSTNHTRPGGFLYIYIFT